MKRLFLLPVTIAILILAGPSIHAATHVLSPQVPEGVVFLPIVKDCGLQYLPTGALPGQPETVFCSIDSTSPDTSESHDNAWLDEFDHNHSFASFAGTDYVIFEAVGFIHETLHWRHANHWMVDVIAHEPDLPVGWVRGGALFRPDATFRFEDGKLIVEADVAAGMTVYDGNAWPELVISTGAQPVDTGSLYGYDMFPEDWTLGCRLQASRYPVCALKSNNGDQSSGEGSTRIWEMSAHQPVGERNFGGSPFEGREEFWRACGENDPDIVCRDRFRLELTETSLTLFVNGSKYFEQEDIPALPAALLTGDIYVYFSSNVVSHPATALRFHWDRIAINPSGPPSAPPGFRITTPELGLPD